MVEFDRLNRLNKEKELLTEEYTKKLNNLNKYIRVMENDTTIEESDNLEVRVFKLYMILNSVVRVAEKINEMGYRVKTNTYVGERKYKSNDITDIIINSDVEIPIELKESVREINAMNAEKAYGRWN